MWMATSQKDLISKAAAVFFPISGFVAMGLDHSVANMFLIPFGIFCGAEITWADMVMKNLVPVTLGNLVGGAVFVAVLRGGAKPLLPPFVDVGSWTLAMFCGLVGFFDFG